MAGPAKYSSAWWAAQPNAPKNKYTGTSGKKVANTPIGTATQRAAMRNNPTRATTQMYDPLGKRTQYGTTAKPFGAGMNGPGAVPVPFTNYAGKTQYIWGSPGENYMDAGAGLPPGTTSGGGGGGGGGYGGGAKPDITGMLALMNRGPQAFTWENLDLPDYVAPAFYKFNSGQYDTLDAGLDSAIDADRISGTNTYGDARTEMAAATARNPFTGPYTQNPQQSLAMQRMMQANNVGTDINQADTNMGVQADQGFGNLMAILGGVTDQSNQSRMRGLAGDERRFNETLDAEQRGGHLSVGMAKARALEKYEQDLWAYGAETAKFNYDIAMQEAVANNTGRNQTNQQNTSMANEFNSGNVQQLLQMLASGQKIDPALLKQYMAPTAPVPKA